jgi:hypothetical protein
MSSLFPLAVISLLTAGCASSITEGTVGDWYAVVTPETPFYHYGPQQGTGPDSQLEKDSIMKVIRPSFGYVKVKLQDGESGYVASEDIGPAPASLVKEKLAPAPAPSGNSASQGKRCGFNTDDPRLVAPPEPLPEATATPQFRY